MITFAITQGRAEIDPGDLRIIKEALQRRVGIGQTHGQPRVFSGQVPAHLGDDRGALLLGLVEEFVVGYTSSSWRDAVAFGFLIVVLLVRPQGLFGRMTAEKV